MTTKMSAPTKVQTIAPTDLKIKIEKDGSINLIDVRTPSEYRGKRVSIARNFPLDKLSIHSAQELQPDGNDRPLYVICHSGARAKNACELLIKAGVNAICVEGGTKACEEAGLPIIHQKNVIPLDRQVRIGAGAFVLTGVLLGTLINPWFLAICGFVGCGLIFAGITDWCGMSVVLARMPWNR